MGKKMGDLMKLVVSIIIVFTANFAQAKCPVEGFGGEQILNAVENAKTCEEASSVAKNCAYGSSFDVATTSIAILKCEQDFEVYAAPLGRAYNTLIAECSKKYEDQQGTMYRSFAAFCALSVAEFFSQTYAKSEE